MVGVKDVDYEILDLRPTIPNIVIEPDTSSKMNLVPPENLKDSQGLQSEKPIGSTDLSLQGPNGADLFPKNFNQPLFMLQNFKEPFGLESFNIQQPATEGNLEQKFLKQEPLNTEKSVSPRLNMVKNDSKKESDNKKA